jgi:hypothetical protein
MPNRRSNVESLTGAVAVMERPAAAVTAAAEVHTRPPRFRSIVAAAQVMTSSNAQVRSALGKVADWQVKGWEYFDAIGEFRNGCEWLSNGLSRVNLVAARTPQSSGDNPSPIQLPDPDDPNDDTPPATAVEERTVELLEALAGGAIGQGQLFAAMAIQLTVAGIGWFVAEPDPNDPTSDEFATYDVLSVEELRNKQGGQPGEYQVQVSDSQWRDLAADALVVKVWQRHPRHRWEADAPTRAVLSTLREIDLLTQHVHASAVSRLAGAGLLVLPLETEFPGSQRIPTPPIEGAVEPEPDPDAEVEPAPSGADLFVDTLVQTMTVPIADRGSAAAVVPLVIQVPGEYVDKVKWLTFSTGFDQRIIALRDNAVKRLALGLDMPPEILTGMADVNHWNAWQIEESAITLHIAPLAEVMCDALTRGYLVTALRSEGFSVDDINSVMFWYDVTDLTVRPDRSAQATEAYDRIELSGEAYVRELGLSPDDRPDDDEKRRRWLEKAALGAPTNAPMFFVELGYLDPSRVPTESPSDAEGDPNPQEPVVDQERTPPEGPPDADEQQAAANRAAIVAACDGVVYRALERAGAKLRSAIGRGVNGGSASVSGDVTRLHLDYDPTVYADLDFLLADAFDRVPEIAARFDVPGDLLTEQLRSYCRALLAAQQEHSYERLDRAL